MADALERLLSYIVEHPIRQDEIREAQLDASAVQNIPAEIAAQVQGQRKDVQRLAPHFAKGLRMAAHGPLVVDDSDSEGNMIAEAFARYLVSPGLASSQGTPLSATGYRYSFEVN